MLRLAEFPMYGNSTDSTRHACLWSTHSNSFTFTHTYRHPTHPQSLSALTAHNTVLTYLQELFSLYDPIFWSVTEPLMQFLDAIFKLLKCLIWLGPHLPQSSEYSSTDSFITLLKGLYIAAVNMLNYPDSLGRGENTHQLGLIYFTVPLQPQIKRHPL